MTDNRNLRPIFVHASFRSASTYFFNVLRQMEPLVCFDEAISDTFTHYDKNNLIRSVRRAKWADSHQFLTRYSRAEFVDAWDDVMRCYPSAPAFRDYLPANGVLSGELHRYVAALIDYASAKGKRAAICEIHSRGRAGALRHAFGGFHVAQYRDPLSQFGSAFRALQESGNYTFMVIPLQELGPNSNTALYSIIPEGWRLPALPWPSDDRGQRWASAQQYLSMVLSQREDAPERVFRWHLFSWFLNNLAAVIYADLVLDIDRAYEDRNYLEGIQDAVYSEIGVTPDFSGLTKFSRYLRFEAFDMARVCDDVIGVIAASQHDGRLESALAMLSKTVPTIEPSEAFNMLRSKIEKAVAQMSSTEALTCVTVENWHEVAQNYGRIWAHPQLRSVMHHIYPFVLPIVQAARRIGIIN
jgi:hypothetical protein